MTDNAEAVPAVSFVSTPVTEGYAFYKYDYPVIPSNYSANLTLYWTDATWAQLLIVDWHLIGFPNDTDYGRVWMSLRLELMNTTFAWQNFTIDIVALEVLLNPDWSVMIPLGIALLFGFGLLAVGFKERTLWLLAGPIWILEGLTIFIDYGQMFMLTALGLGLTLFFMGAYHVYK